MGRPKILFSGETEHLCYTAYANGKATITEWSGHCACVVIPETIRGMRVTEIARCAFCGNHEIKQVILPDSLERIGNEAFFGCTALCTVNIPSNVCCIGVKAFQSTPWLDAQQGPFVIVGDGCLLRCTDSNTHIRIPDGVKTIGHAFFDCPDIEEVTLPDSVTRLAPEAFSLCIKMKRFTAGIGLRSVGARAFSRCVKLQQVHFPNTLSYVGDHAFLYCTSLQEITLSGVHLRLGEGVFKGCTNLRRVQICGEVRHLPVCTFQDCGALETCTLPGTIQTIGTYAFDFCENLRTVSMPQALRRIEKDAFSGCKVLDDLIIPAGVEHIGLFALEDTPWFQKQTAPFVIVGNGVLIACNGETQELCIPQGVRAVDCYYQGENLQSVVIPEGVVEIGRAAFESCKSLKKIVLPKSLREISEDAFRNTKINPACPNGLQLQGERAFCTDEAEAPILRDIMERYSGKSSGLSFLCGKYSRDIYTDLQVRLKGIAQMFTLGKWLDACARTSKWNIPNMLATHSLFLDGEAFDWADEDDGLLLKELLQFRERNQLFTLMLVDYKNEAFRRWVIEYEEKHGEKYKVITRYIADGRRNTR